MTATVTSAQSTPSFVNPLRAYSKWQQKHYPLELWWAINCFITLISLFHLASIAMAYHSKRPARSIRPGAQSGPNAGPGALRNAPSAVLSIMQKMSVAKMVMSGSYLAALLIWGFINSISYEKTGTSWTFIIVRPIRSMVYEAFLISHIIVVAMYLIFGLLHAPERWMKLAWKVSSDTVRLTVHRPFKWKSGQHAYILTSTIAKLPFEVHPFTIASAYSKEVHKSGCSQELVFIVRGRDGFTKRLLEASETRQSIPVVIDGPYGAPPCLSHHSTCIFLAGGSGVSYTLSLLLELVRIKVYITQQSLPELVHENMVLNKTVQIYSKQSLIEKSISSLTGFQVMKVLDGRPDIGAIFEEGLSCAGSRVSIDVSGPLALADATCDALVACSEAQLATVLRGVPRTTLHVECAQSSGIRPGFDGGFPVATCI
ncbi:FAD-binding domain-containing protein [Rhizoctonia solani]|nr:FAD-binding domain-containing protein [Rhizoctonia solani]